MLSSPEEAILLASPEEAIWLYLPEEAILLSSPEEAILLASFLLHFDQTKSKAALTNPFNPISAFISIFDETVLSLSVFVSPICSTSKKRLSNRL